MTPHRPITEKAGVRAERVLILTHGAAEVTEGVMPTVLSVVDARGVEVVTTDEEAAKHPALAGRTVIAPTDLRPGGVDLVLVLGGDGSILRALSREATTGAPVLGVNYGRVGFLASVEQSDLERGIGRALDGEYITLGLPSLKAEWSEGTLQAVNDLAFLRGGIDGIRKRLALAGVGRARGHGALRRPHLLHPGGVHGLQPGGGRPHGVVARQVLRAVVHRRPSPGHPAVGACRR